MNTLIDVGIDNIVDYRKAISLFPTGVAVVSAEDGVGGVHGMTVSSFTSISLDPPTVMISLKAGRMHQLVNNSGVYGVSILQSYQSHYSAHFGGKPNPEVSPCFVTRDHIPTLEDSLGWFECRVIERIQIKDHTLFIAQISAFGHGMGAPLIYYASRFPDHKISTI